MEISTQGLVWEEDILESVYRRLKRKPEMLETSAQGGNLEKKARCEKKILPFTAVFTWFIWVFKHRLPWISDKLTALYTE